MAQKASTKTRARKARSRAAGAASNGRKPPVIEAEGGGYLGEYGVAEAWQRMLSGLERQIVNLDAAQFANEQADDDPIAGFGPEEDGAHEGDDGKRYPTYAQRRGELRARVRAAEEAHPELVEKARQMARGIDSEIGARLQSLLGTEEGSLARRQAEEAAGQVEGPTEE